MDSGLIGGVVITKLTKISDERGTVMHMMKGRLREPLMCREIYFSTINPRWVKAWKKHTKMTQNLAVIAGVVRFVMFDDRSDSSTFKMLQSIELGEENYSRLKIPCGIWYGFQNRSSTISIIANCTDLPHDPSEVERLAAETAIIPYDWRE